MTTYMLKGFGNSIMSNISSNADILVEGTNLGACERADVAVIEEWVFWSVPKRGWISVDGKKVKGPASGSVERTR